MKNRISWVHFGDLHIRSATDENYLDFLDLVEEINAHLAGHVDFAFLPGDNADDGAEQQYELIRRALSGLRLPVHVITGDHDRKGGSLDAFQRFLEPALYRAVDLHGYRLLFLNAMDGPDAKIFDFGPAQIQWLEAQLKDAKMRQLQPIVFTHLYPSELATQAHRFTELIRRFGVDLVEMGHTHYNEVANDGRTLYATTRSTGQTEEGPPGFSITCIDEGVISWKFKQRGHWPFVIITSPADQRFITKTEDPCHVVRGVVNIRAHVWGASPEAAVMCSIDQGPKQPMQRAGESWQCSWNTTQLEEGIHRVEVKTNDARDEIAVYVSQGGKYSAPLRKPIDFENDIGAYPEKGILGTQLGPNDKGTKGPWPSWRRSS